MRRSSRNKRHIVSEGVCVPVDRFSDLPDSIICHVLSFLPTTDEVVRTSILSNRWKDLWTNVHTLIFPNSKNVAPEKMQYSQFVYRVLRFHRGSIKKMKFYPGSEYDDIENWISSAIDQGLETLSLTTGLTIGWPLCLFNSDKLVELEISNVDITNLNIPSAPFCPSLKELHFRIRVFDPETLKRLISGCLVLEDLFIVLLVTEEISLNLSSSTLKRLVISCYIDSNHHKIELAVPALEFLNVCCPPPTEICLKGWLSSLTEVNINIKTLDAASNANEDICRNSLVRFMERISNVKVFRLRLDCGFKKPLTFAMHAQFPNLTKLCIGYSFFEWPLLRSFIESSTNLEAIYLQQFGHWVADKENQVFWIDPQNVLHCLLSSLREIFIHGHSIEDVLDMVNYILRNAEVLEWMDIQRDDFDGYYEAQCQILQKLVMMKRASRGCELSFV